MATYKHVLEEVLKPVAVAILGAVSGSASNVKYGAHQVAAGGQNVCAASSREMKTAQSFVSFLFDG